MIYFRKNLENGAVKSIPASARMNIDFSLFLFLPVGWLGRSSMNWHLILPFIISGLISIHLSLSEKQWTLPLPWQISMVPKYILFCLLTCPAWIQQSIYWMYKFYFILYNLSRAVNRRDLRCKCLGLNLVSLVPKARPFPREPLKHWSR